MISTMHKWDFRRNILFLSKRPFSRSGHVHFSSLICGFSTVKTRGLDRGNVTYSFCSFVGAVNPTLLICTGNQSNFAHFHVLIKCMQSTGLLLNWTTCSSIGMELIKLRQTHVLCDLATEAFG